MFYPGSVFKGCKCGKKYITLITDNTSISAGDIGPNLFTGKNDDGNLGVIRIAELWEI